MRANVYIRKENEAAWAAIEDKSEWVNKKLERPPKTPKHKPDATILSPKVAKEHPELVEQFDRLAAQIKPKGPQCKVHGDTIGRNGKCLQKGCKYA